MLVNWLRIIPYQLIWWRVRSNIGYWPYQNKPRCSTPDQKWEPATVTPINDRASNLWLKRTWCFRLGIKYQFYFSILWILLSFKLILLVWSSICQTRAHPCTWTSRDMYALIVLESVTWSIAHIHQELFPGHLEPHLAVPGNGVSAESKMHIRLSLSLLNRSKLIIMWCSVFLAKTSQPEQP